MKNIYILGAAGSIGMQTLDIIKAQSDQFKLIGVSLSRDDHKNDLILSTFPVEIACLRNDQKILFYEKKYPKTSFVFGDKGLLDIAKYPKPGILVNALSGSVGLYPTIEAIKQKKDIALANKETLVMAGDIVNQYIKDYQVKLLPIDSEHSAIWQTLDEFHIDDIKKIVITASGGAFRDKTRDDLIEVTVEDALRHPNWSMGPKVTIDSATMMNKGLEIIEAHHLFHLPYDKIETVLHKESLVHGLTYYKDGTIKASLGQNDMHIPIGYALNYPNRMTFQSEFTLKDMHFSPMDFQRFPLLQLAYEVGKAGGLLPVVMNAANEAAVKLFLENKITFLSIEEIVIRTVKQFSNKTNPTLEDILKTDKEVQQTILDFYEKR
ncbi:MAG: 1-deoxy-D-xylulose-5-phosphate reductoisomerase [Acholeplasmataceae bacterium]